MIDQVFLVKISLFNYHSTSWPPVISNEAVSASKSSLLQKVYNILRSVLLSPTINFIPFLYSKKERFYCICKICGISTLHPGIDGVLQIRWQKVYELIFTREECRQHEEGMKPLPPSFCAKKQNLSCWVKPRRKEGIIENNVSEK